MHLILSLTSLSSFSIKHFLYSENEKKFISYISIVGLCDGWRPSTSRFGQTADNLTQFVNPRIGTGGHGHVFLGANVPFGYVQLGPTEHTRGWDWCSGYHESDSVLIGFGHQHLSGTGIGELGDVAFLPVTDAKQKEVVFHHANENVRPGYYAVKLQQPNVWVELTATKRAGFHRYTFGADVKKAQLVLDLFKASDGISPQIMP